MLWSISLQTIRHKCIHDQLPKPEPQTNLLTAETPTADRDQWNPIRIYFDYDQLSSEGDTERCKETGDIVEWGGKRYTCRLEDVLTPPVTKTIKDTFDFLQEYVSSLLKVNPITTSGWTLSTLNGAYPDGKTGSSDMDIFVSVAARPFGESSVTLASAQPLLSFSAQSLRRPYHSIININVARVPSKPENLTSANRAFFETVLHELIHALGITSIPDTSQNWWNPETNAQYGTGSTSALTMARYPGKTFTILHTKNCHQYAVDRWGLEKFEDPDNPSNFVPSGIEIEDNGGTGTAGSHPEVRVYLDDMFAGMSLSDTRISLVSLSMLQDTGWYQVNFSMAEKAAWGAGEAIGEGKLKDFPIGDPQTHFPKQYICSPEDLGHEQCTYDLLNGATCTGFYNNCTDETPDEDHKQFCEWRKFTDPAHTFMMGPTAVHDFMFYKSPYSDVRCNNRDRNDDTARSNGELYGGESFCAISTLMRGYLGFYDFPHGACHRMVCRDDGNLDVYVEDQKRTCTKAGQKMIFLGFMGSLICPDPKHACAMREYYGQLGEAPLIVPKTWGLTVFYWTVIVVCLIIIVIFIFFICCCRNCYKKRQARLNPAPLLGPDDDYDYEDEDEQEESSSSSSSSHRAHDRSRRSTARNALVSQRRRNDDDDDDDDIAERRKSTRPPDPPMPSRRAPPPAAPENTESDSGASSVTESSSIPAKRTTPGKNPYDRKFGAQESSHSSSGDEEEEEFSTALHSPHGLNSDSESNYNSTES